MLVKKQISDKKNQILIAVILAALTGTGYFLYRNFFPSAVPATEAPKAPVVVVKGHVLPADFGGELLASPDFKELKTYGNVPVKVKNIGKTDPFGLE